MKKCLINCANLHVGGGIQVAASIIQEFTEIDAKRTEVSITISDEVQNAIGDDALFDKSAFIKVIPYNVRGFNIWDGFMRNVTHMHEVVFTVFGPIYRWRPPFKNVVGFAQAWIIYPNNEVYQLLPIFSRFRTRFKFWIQAQFFKRADVIVVELDHVKDGLVRELGVDPTRIHVIKNCVSSIYMDDTHWAEVDIPVSGGELRLGFIGRNYLHKNTAMFPQIVASLREKHMIAAKFYVTFTEAEWLDVSLEFKKSCINVGPLSPAQCPKFYQSMDAVVFPSLLECFSATPLEAMAMEKPLFVSDRPFNRDICSEFANYFDPKSPDDAAAIIARTFGRNTQINMRLRAARDHAFSFSSPQERARQYLELLEIT
jgi:glycosyltransferase involved in cell wall biosynthesis